MINFQKASLIEKVDARKQKNTISILFWRCNSLQSDSSLSRTAMAAATEPNRQKNKREKEKQLHWIKPNQKESEP